MPKTKQVIEEDDEIFTPVGRTRYGRKVKKPVRYEPLEKVEDDFSESDYDNNNIEPIVGESIVSDDSEAESSSSDDDSDADENGNLKDFVTYSDSEDEEESVEKDVEEEEDFTDTDDSDYSDSE